MGNHAQYILARKTGWLLIYLLVFSAGSFSHVKSQRSRLNLQLNASSDTLALIIGISKYEHIEPLKYAHEDARAFRAYLCSTNGGSLSPHKTRLLLNGEATSGSIFASLAFIRDSLEKNDVAYIYFSGHADVETENISNRGFLLTNNTSETNYYNGGISVEHIRDFVTSMKSKGVKVVMIIDACKSGKLAGGNKGARLTSESLMQVWANEIKILSATPGQISIESTLLQSGLFTYYLIKGLKGEADGIFNMSDQTNLVGHSIDNDAHLLDSSISLSELNLYLTTNVSQISGAHQTPIVLAANMKEIISIVSDKSPPLLASAKLGYNGISNASMDSPSSSLESLNDESDKQNKWPPLMTYLNFIKSIGPKLAELSPQMHRLNHQIIESTKKKNVFGPPKKKSILYLYNQLKKVDKQNTLLPGVKQLLQHVLLDSVNNQITQYIDIGKTSFINQDFTNLVVGIDLVIKLFPNDSITVNDLRAKLLFFTSFDKKQSIPNKIRILREAIEIEKDMAILWNEVGNQYVINNDYKTAFTAYEEARRIAPRWEIPIRNEVKLKAKQRVRQRPIADGTINNIQERDADGDGVPDHRDHCPDIKGIPMYLGCLAPEENPAKDTDGDGVADAKDNCPNVKGLITNGGCPKSDASVEDQYASSTDIAAPVSPSAIAKTSEILAADRELIVNAMEQIYFESGSKKLQSRSFAVLDQIADMLERNPDYQLDITGHTDNTGSEKDNVVLSIQRAFEVKYYLAHQKGVRLARITSDGEADDKPVSDNITEAGRKLNRRVEFRLYKVGTPKNIADY